MKKIIFLLLLMLIIPSVSAASHIKLLAVKDDGEEMAGSLADLYLDIKPGSGRVFLETYPLTKLDMQLSTRFAKEIACSFLDKDCDRYDFFYTIEAESGIVGGPSAGAAVAVLTIAELEGLGLDQRVAVTGTINSGGSIGSVGGLKEKIDAASSTGIKKVLVASTDVRVESDDNETVNLTQYALEKNVDVAEISTLGEAMYEFTGKYGKKKVQNITVNEDYKQTMKELALLLCNRSASLKQELKEVNTTDIDNMTQKAGSAIENEKYYTGASYCFGANYKYKTLLFENLTTKEITSEVNLTQKEIKKINITSNMIETITDLQAYIITRNRLSEANEYIENTLANLNDSKQRAANLAYALERVYSAKSWMQFFGKGEKTIELDKNVLKNGCLAKIAEAEERYEYAKIYLPTKLEGIRSGIDNARSLFKTQEFELCLFEASKAKASANIILSSLSISKKQLNKTIEIKNNLVKSAINSQTKQGIWPIIGYSYYEYSDSLKYEDPYSALLYSEYALEMSNLDPYLKQRKPTEQIILIKRSDINLIKGLIVGLIVGFIIALKIRIKCLNPRARLRRASVSGKKR